MDFEAPEPGTVRNPETLSVESRAKRPLDGQKEGIDRLMELRSRPDAVYAGRLVGPWTAIRFTLMKEFEGDAEATQIAEAIKPHLLVLQQGRRDPTRHAPLGETATALEELIKQITENRMLMANETITSAVKKHQLTLSEYRNALANADDAADSEEDSE